MQLVFSSNKEHVLSKLEYEALWQVYGHKIQHAFEKIAGLSFKEDNIDSIVGNYESNFAGNTLKEPMLFRFSVRHKLGTIIHELSHRFLIEYQFQYANVLENDHELIDLFLYDVIQESFGESAARERVAYECTFPELEIPNAWNKILKHSKSKRRELWNTVLKNTLIL